MSSLEFNKIMQKIKKKIHETRNYLLDEIKHDDLMSEIRIHVTHQANYVRGIFMEHSHDIFLEY